VRVAARAAGDTSPPKANMYRPRFLGHRIEAYAA
jgi:hypothetical protein